MEFLWLGNMTLFICFVQSSLLLPTTSPFWNRAVHGSRQRNRMFLWHSHSKLCGFGENNRLIGGESGSAPCIVPAGGALLTNSWLHKKWASVSPSCAGAGIQPIRHLDGFDQLSPVLSVSELEVRGAVPWKPAGAVLPSHGSTHMGRLPSLSLSHFMSTQSVIQTLHKAVSVPCKCSRLAKISATCRSHPHSYQLQKGWTGGARGQSQLWLVLMAEGQTGAVQTGWKLISVQNQRCV